MEIGNERKIESHKLKGFFKIEKVKGQLEIKVTGYLKLGKWRSIVHLFEKELLKSEVKGSFNIESLRKIKKWHVNEPFNSDIEGHLKIGNWRTI